MYEIGEKLRCVKNRGNMHLVGNNYEVVKLSVKTNTISLSIEKYSNNIFDYCDYRLFKKSEEDHIKSWLLSDHFMSLKEERSLKLKKIYERRR